MNFKNWMQKNYLKDNSWNGRLARDIHADEKFPKNGIMKFNGWYRLIHKYLEDNCACTEILEAFNYCWKEYEECERVRLKKPLSKQ